VELLLSRRGRSVTKQVLEERLHSDGAVATPADFTAMPAVAIHQPATIALIVGLAGLAAVAPHPSKPERGPVREDKDEPARIRQRFDTMSKG
jgi:hypothetical protein